MRLLKRVCKLLLVLAVFPLCGSSTTVAQMSQLVRADRETIFSEEFLDALRAAGEETDRLRSVAPLLQLLDKYSKVEEIAELELAIGATYGYGMCCVNPAEAVIHLTKALRYELPEGVRVRALVWRAGSLTQQGKHADAIRDHLRVLLTISYRDLAGGCPQIEGSPLPIYMGYGSDDPENQQRILDNRRYRAEIALTRQFLLDRFNSIDQVKHAQKQLGIDDEPIARALRELSPDKSRHEIVLGWLRAENRRPPC